MFALFIGGIKSGKSKNAELFTHKHSVSKPIYLATNEFFDSEMHQRILRHKQQRADKFITVEEPLQIDRIINKADSILLVECISMWINNMLYHERSESDITEQLYTILKLKKDIVFVINDVSNSVVSDNSLVRQFVDINGRVSQLIASHCDEVYNTIAGISVRIK